MKRIFFTIALLSTVALIAYSCKCSSVHTTKSRPENHSEYVTDKE